MQDYSDPQMQAAIEMGVPLHSPVEGVNHVYGYVKQNPLVFTDPFGLRNRGDGRTNSGSRSNAKSSCVQRCFTEALKSGLTEGLFSLVPTFRAVTTVAKASGVSAYAGYNAYGTAACIVKCEEDEEEECRPND